MSRAPRARKSSRSKPTTEPAPERRATARHVHLGDVLKIERRYVVDGALTSVTDEGFFKGVQTLGSTEHLLLEDAAADGVRMIPIHSISEIFIVGAKPPTEAAFDPSVA